MGRGTYQIATIADCKYLSSTSFPAGADTDMGTKYTALNQQWYNGYGGSPFKSVFCDKKLLGSIKFGDASTDDGDITKKYYITYNVNCPYEIINQEPVAHYAKIETAANEQAIYFVLTTTNFCPDVENLNTASNVVTYVKCFNAIFPAASSTTSIIGDNFFELTRNEYYNTTFYIWVLAKSTYKWLLYDRDNKAINSWFGYERFSNGQIAWSCVRKSANTYDENQCVTVEDVKNYFYINQPDSKRFARYADIVNGSQSVRPDIVGWCEASGTGLKSLTTEQYYGIYGTSSYSNKNLNITCTLYPYITGSSSYGTVTSKNLTYTTASTQTGTLLSVADVKSPTFKAIVKLNFPAIIVNPSTIGKVGGSNVTLSRTVNVPVTIKWEGIGGGVLRGDSDTYSYSKQIIVTFTQIGTYVNQTQYVFAIHTYTLKDFTNIPFFSGVSVQNPKVYIHAPSVTWSTQNSSTSATSEIGLWEDE